jgi:hypothetical protein
MIKKRDGVKKEWMRRRRRQSGSSRLSKKLKRGGKASMISVSY